MILLLPEEHHVIDHPAFPDIYAAVADIQLAEPISDAVRCVGGFHDTVHVHAYSGNIENK